jgi:hypothetical protein
VALTGDVCLGNAMAPAATPSAAERPASEEAEPAIKKLRIAILAEVWHGATEKGP